MQQNNIIKIRATQHGVSIVCDDQATIPELVAALKARLQSHARFYADADVKLDIGNRTLSTVELVPIRSLLEDEFHLRLSGIVCSQDALIRQAMSELGCQIEVDAPVQSDPQPRSETPGVRSDDPGNPGRFDNEDETLIVRQTCRSGMTMASPGNIVIIGNVNPGAEVIAQHDIIVVGVLRGNAHAGAGGDASAVIMALALEPKQLRIANLLGLPPTVDEPPDRSKFAPEVAYIDSNRIVIEPYTGRYPVA